MKTQKSAFIVLFVFTICFLNCKKTIENLTTIDSPEVKTAFVVQLFDAKTNKLIGQDSDKEIRVTVLGTDRSSVKTVFGKSVSQLTTHKGVIALSISNTINPSAEDPVEFVLDFECDGYLHGSIPVQIASMGGHSFIARLVDASNPPDGISIFNGVVGRSNSEGITESQIMASTPPVQQTLATTQVIIPEGSKILDKSGNPLTGDLSLRMAYYSNQSPEVLDCFPGSFCVKTEENGIPGNALFFSGGWADYELTDQSGLVAKTFSNPIDIMLEIPPNTFNPETNSQIQTGEFYPVWNYRYTDGTWELENEGLLKGPSSHGNFYVDYQAFHFSKKNTDKKKCPEQKPPPDCDRAKDWRKYLSMDQKLFLNDEKNNQKSYAFLNNNSETYSVPSNIRLVLKEPTTNFVYWSSGYLDSYTQGDQIYLPDAPCDLPSIFEVWGGCPYSLLGSELVNNLCLLDPVEIQLSNPNPPTGSYVNVELTITVNCDFAHIRPNISAFYEDGCGWKYIGQVVNGKITMPGLEMNKGYAFGVWINDYWFDEFFTINQTSYTWNIDVPENICNSYQ